MGGVVVRAERGERQHYRPIISTLCSSADPLAIMQALLRLYPFDTFYIADLDAIMGMGDNMQAVLQFQQNFPQINFWVDAGVRQASQLQALRQRGLTSVVGSEYISDLKQYQALQVIKNKAILSLDFNKTGFMGNSALLEQVEEWPEQLIAITLAQVGSYAGLDIEQLERLKSRAGARRLYAAGGTRNIEDLKILASKKLAGALVASALHDGRITQVELADLQLT
jgi:phosphoribosylformimino-5-aminoimidazole carboxamide ribotide isomerase